jgi:hypothetical protein
MTRRTRADRTAGWIAEAIATGHTLAALPPELAPRDRAEGERVAFLVLDALGIAPCGLRMAGDVAGPMIEGRLLPEGATAAPLRHPVVTAALVGVLREPLDPDGEEPPALSALHPALDIADRRFTDAPAGVAQRSADLGGLGFVVAGAPGDPTGEPIAIGPASITLHDALAPATAAARRMGGLPAGALLVAAGLSKPLAVDAEGRVALGFGSLGMVTAQLA